MTTEQTLLRARGVVSAVSKQDYEKDDGTEYSRVVLDIVLDGNTKPTRFSTFSTSLVPKGTQNKRVLVEYVDKKATDRQGNPLTFHNLTKISLVTVAPEPDEQQIFDDESPPPEEEKPTRTSMRPPVEQKPESKRILEVNRVEQGMAYGNAHHAASRLLEGYLIAYHHEPSDEEIDRLVSIQLEMARRLYEGREALG